MEGLAGRLNGGHSQSVSSWGKGSGKEKGPKGALEYPSYKAGWQLNEYKLRGQEKWITVHTFEQRSIIMRAVSAGK